MNNKDWSEKILQKFDPDFKHRWVIYNELLIESLGDNIVWLDCGAGNNGIVDSFGHLAKTAIGIDLAKPGYKKNYVRGDIQHLPFKTRFADLITLRFVVEHFDNPSKYFDELNRIVKPGEKIIILTTNILSPFIFLPKVFLPQSIKSRLLIKIFKVQEDDIFPTYHRLNSPYKFEKLKSVYELDRIQFISDLNYTRKWMFLILLIWHLITKPKFLNKFRTNILVVLEKL
jgi:ubiquinone/menaquinone biosynthesis C-methylase UbiE